MPPRLGPILVAAAFATGALGAGAWWLATHREEVLTDDGAIEQAADSVHPRDILWTPPARVDHEALPAEAVGGALSPRGDRFAFAAPGPGGDLDLYEAVEAEGHWRAVRLELASSLDHDTTPRYSHDGRWLWFASDRPGGAGGLDLWRAPAESDGWGLAEHVPLDNLPSGDDELSPAFTPDGKILAFCRRADAQSPGDLVLLTLEPDGSAAVLDHDLNSWQSERAPAFSPAGDFLYFASDRDGGAGGLDLYRARLGRDSLGEAQWLGEEVNSASDETDPALAMAGFRLRFRHIGDGETGYREVTAREVYRTVRSRWPDLGVAGELLALLPWLLLLLALALLFAGLRRIARGEHWQRRWRALGLMSRCVLASMALHALLALLLSLWRVETTLPGLDEDTSTQVRLTSHSAALAAAAQIRAASVAAHPAPQPPPTRPPGSAPADAALRSLEPAPDAAVPVSDTPAAAEPVVQPTRPPAWLAQPEVTGAALPVPAPAHATDQPPAEVSLDPGPATAFAPAEKPTEAHLAPAPSAASGLHAPMPSISAIPARPLALEAAPAPMRQVAADIPSLPAGARGSEAEAADVVPTPPIRRDGPAASHAPQARPVELAAPTPPLPVPSDSPAGTAPPTPSRIALEDPLPAGPRTPTLPTGGGSPVQAEARPATDPVYPPLAGVGLGPVATLLEASPAAGPPAAPIAPLPDSARGNVRLSTPLPEAPPGEQIGTTVPTSAPTLLPEIRSGGDSTLGQSPTLVPASPPLVLGPATPGPVEFQPAVPEVRPLPLPVPQLSPIRESAVLAPPSPPPRDRTPMLPMARVIAGVVVNRQTGEPIPQATVRLDGEGDLIRRTRSADDGRFTLTPAALPDFAALTASAEGFVPGAVNIAERDVGDGLWVELRLEPATGFDIALDPEPRVHHLGNDEFTGRINSKFQVRSQGTAYRATVELEREQLLRPIGGAQLHLFVRGAQNRNQIIVNDRVLDTPITGSPEDGSFGTLVAEIPLSLLREGENVIIIRAVSRRGTDIDDFEFVNPRLILKPHGAVPDNRL